MIAFDEIVTTVLRILVAHGYAPVGISIHLTIPRHDFDGMPVEDADRISESQIESHNKIEDIWWSCVLSPVNEAPFKRMPLAESSHLKSLLKTLAVELKAHYKSFQAYQIDWVLEANEFDEKFVDHPNLVTDRIIQASERIEETYCSVQVLRKISLRR